MPVYVMSDLHGCKDEFDAMLRKIEFSAYDELWIVGDICDRGKQSISLLKEIAANDNMHVIMGNHDVWLRRYMPIMIEGKHDASRIYTAMTNDFMTWLYYNGGMTTLDQFMDEDFNSCYDLQLYMEKVPYYTAINVHGQNYVLVHAGCGASPAPGTRVSEVTHFNQVWSHIGIDDNPYTDGTRMIVGHMPTFIYGKEYDGKILHGKDDRIFHIDCGCVYGRTLGCLRLDDLHEFYIESSYPYLKVEGS